MIINNTQEKPFSNLKDLLLYNIDYHINKVCLTNPILYNKICNRNEKIECRCLNGKPITYRQKDPNLLDELAKSVKSDGVIGTYIYENDSTNKKMTITEYTLPDGTKSYILKAGDKKNLVRKSGGFNFGNEVWLGYRYTDEGKILEVPEDFIEVDNVEDDLESFE